MTTITIKGLGNIDSVYLTDRDLTKIGTKKQCLRCKQTMIIGYNEIELAKKTAKGRIKTTYEVYSTEEIFDIKTDRKCEKIEKKGDILKNKFKKLESNIIVSDLTMVEQAIIFGVQAIHYHICPDCRNKNKELVNNGQTPDDDGVYHAV